MLLRSRFRRRGDLVEVRFGGGERGLLVELLDELERVVADEGRPDARRLFPPAHDDAEREAQYRELVGDQLRTGRSLAIDAVRATLDAKTLDLDAADTWARVLTDLRLVLGTRLDVQEGETFSAPPPNDPRAREFAVFAYLSWLQEDLVAVLLEGP